MNGKLLQKTLAVSCDKIHECNYVSEACRKPLKYEPDTMRAIPARRWIDCAGWKLTLGMILDKKSGSWVYPTKLPDCLHCQPAI